MIATTLLAADEIVRRLELARVPSGWFALGSVVLLALLLFWPIHLYRREQRAGAHWKLRAGLAAIRCTVIVLLALIWLEPILATYLHRRIEAWTLILSDNSASMSLKDLYPEPEDAERVAQVLERSAGPGPSERTRAQIARAALADGESSVLARLAGDNPVRVYAFGDRLLPVGEVEPDGVVPVPESSGGLAAPEGPEGVGSFGLDALMRASAGATDVGKAIRQAIEAQGASPVAAVVVLSDGRFNQGEPVEVVARYARSKNIPIHTVGVGDPTTPRNVTVAAIEAPPNVFVKDPFKVTAHLRAQGLANHEIVVELLEKRDASAQPVPVDARRVRINPDGSLPPVEFERTIGEAAEVTTQIRVPRQEGELLLDDNVREITIRALENKMRVLLVSGSPSWEYRYLSRLLERDATMEVSCWLQSADEDAVRDGNVIIDQFPRDQEELNVYDCIILLDPQPVDFDPGWTEKVDSLVGSYGGGLLYVAGRKYAPRFVHAPRTRTLIDLLPVVLSASEADLILNELGHFQMTSWPVIVPSDAMGHPVLALSDVSGETEAIWSQLGGVFWHYPPTRAKPVADVLLRHSSPRMRDADGGHVLLALQYYGSGRTGYLGFDTTWRWRRYGDEYFNRFWVQLIRHLVKGKLLSGQKRGLIQVERERYAVGEAVNVEARLLDARHLPLEREEVELQITHDGQPVDPVPLASQSGRPGWYRGRFVPKQVGTFTVEIHLPGGDGVPPATIRSEVRVGQPDLEFRQIELDRIALEVLAAQSAGGRYLEINEVDRLPELIPDQTTTLTLSGQPTSLWDGWWTWGLLVGLLGVEWALRKRARLL